MSQGAAFLYSYGETQRDEIGIQIMPSEDDGFLIFKERTLFPSFRACPKAVMIGGRILYYLELGLDPASVADHVIVGSPFRRGCFTVGENITAELPDGNRIYSPEEMYVTVPVG
jgi:hypothetical protein